MYLNGCFFSFFLNILMKFCSLKCFLPCRLPPIYLIHGTDDIVVPPLSTEKFSSALIEKEAVVTVRLIGEGGHAELVMDMMESGRQFYDAMTNLTLEFAEKMLK